MSGLEIFKAGTFTGMDGKQYIFTDDDVQATVAAYDPALFSAPLVVGHPKVEDPAYGWVSGLAIKDGIVTAAPEKVEPSFAEMVNDGRFPKISSSFWPPSHPSNPKPGVWYLRHVGFLGAAAPAVKGLKPASFSDDADSLVTIEFADADFESRWVLGRLARGLRDWMLEKFGSEAADQVIPDYLARDAERAGDPQQMHSQPSFAAPIDTTHHQEEPTVDPNKDKPNDKQQAADFAERETALQTREQQLAEKEKALADKAAIARKEDIAEFADKLVNDGKVLPREKEGLVAFMEALDEDTVVEFAEGDNTVKQASSQWLGKFLDGLPARVDFSERGAAEEDGEATAQFAAPAGYSVDPDALAIHNKALAYQAKNQCDYTTAINAVS